MKFLRCIIIKFNLYIRNIKELNWIEIELIKLISKNWLELDWNVGERWLGENWWERGIDEEECFR